jgi:hypothetical protein
MRSEITEKFLNDNGFKWEYFEEYPLASIDMKGVENNLGRMGEALNIPHAKSLALVIQKQNGSINAIVVLANGDKKSTVGTGVHRIKGALEFCQPPRTTLPAYEVYEANAARRQLLIRSLNSIEGKGSDVDERLAHIMEVLRANPNRNRKELAEQFSVSKSLVDDYARVITFDQRARRSGLDGPSRDFAHKMKMRLQDIQSRAVFDRVIRLVAKYPDVFRGRMADSLLEELGAEIERGERRALVYLADRDAALEAAGPRKATHASPGNDTKLFGHIKAALKLATLPPDKLYGSTDDAELTPNAIRGREKLAWTLAEVLTEKTVSEQAHQLMLLQQTEEKRPKAGKPRSATSLVE